MQLLNLTVQHGRTLDEAAHSLEEAVQQVSEQFGTFVRRVEWSGNRHRVRLNGVGFWIEMWVDAQAIHATGDIPVLGGFIGRSLGTGLKQILQQTFQKKLP